MRQQASGVVVSMTPPEVDRLQNGKLRALPVESESSFERIRRFEVFLLSDKSRGKLGMRDVGKRFRRYGLGQLCFRTGVILEIQEFLPGIEMEFSVGRRG